MPRPSDHVMELRGIESFEIHAHYVRLTGVGIWCFPLRDDRFLRVRRRARMWVRKQQYPCQPICLVPKRRQKAICLPSPQIYTYPCQLREEGHSAASQYTLIRPGSNLRLNPSMVCEELPLIL